MVTTIKYLIVLGALVLSPLFSFSQNDSLTELIDTSSIGPQEIEEIEYDEIIPVISANTYFEFVKDSNYGVPAYEHYFFWDTTDIHPYRSRMNKFNEVRLLCLTDSLSGYSIPVRTKVNSDFGWRKWKYHFGIDFDIESGDSIYSAFEGMVRVVRRSKTYGQCVVIRHNNGLETLYAHLSKPKVTSNQYVKAGEFIGLGGNTGRSTGPHLHFEVRYLGGAINPNNLFDFKNFTLRSDTLAIDSLQFAYLNDVQKARYYTIRKGDSLSRIAKKTGVSISRLCKLNGITRKTILRIGRKIRYT